jgi:hypothetical protein
MYILFYTNTGLFFYNGKRRQLLELVEVESPYLDDVVAVSGIVLSEVHDLIFTLRNLFFIQFSLFFFICSLTKATDLLVLVSELHLIQASSCGSSILVTGISVFKNF